MKVRGELEAPERMRRFGSGWLTGVGALVLAVAGLFFVLCLRFPAVLTVPPLRGWYEGGMFRVILHLGLLTAFGLSALALCLRQNKVLGLTAMGVVLVAALLGGSRTRAVEGSEVGEVFGGVYLGLDWFVLNVLMTGFLFVPMERLFPRRPGQALFRTEWREDLFYYLVSSLLVQVLTLVSMAPAMAIAANTQWTSVRSWVGAQPLLLQVVAIMFLTDFVQYWLHRAFHRVPFLWKFHAVHHSAQTMDWMAGARMHFLEIIVLRGTTVIPMYVLGFSESALHIYVLLVYFHSTLVHANVGWELGWIGRFLVTPRFHHWHHGIDKEAIDVNFAIHFPLFDRLFGTFHLPKGQWPTGYGIEGHPVPRSYWRQFLYPFGRKSKQK